MPRKTDELKRRFRHIPDVMMNTGETDIADLEIAEDYIEHIPMPPQYPPNRAGFKGFVGMLRTAFPDLHYTVDHLTSRDLIGENQKVAHRIVATATHLGPWGNIPPSGKQMTWSEIHIGLYVEGRLVEHWGNIDTLSILQQMGAIPGWYEKPPPAPRPYVEIVKETTCQENVALVRRYISEGWNKNNLAVIDELIHPESVDPSFTQYPVGPAGAKLAIAMLRNAFPDLYLLIQDTIAEEDVVAIRYTAIGTHRGAYMHIPPTGRSIEVGGCSIFHFANGQIIERWQEFDTLGLYTQLGMGGG